MNRVQGRKEAAGSNKKIYREHKNTYSAKRITKEFKSKGTMMNHKKVARIMHEANLGMERGKKLPGYETLH
ncbi:IS3 family transposase [Virgibacillus oceani]